MNKVNINDKNKQIKRKKAVRPNVKDAYVTDRSLHFYSFSSRLFLSVVFLW